MFWLSEMYCYTMPILKNYTIWTLSRKFFTEWMCNVLLTNLHWVHSRYLTDPQYGYTMSYWPFYTKWMCDILMATLQLGQCTFSLYSQTYPIKRLQLDVLFIWYVDDKIIHFLTSWEFNCQMTSSSRSYPFVV